ncbi:uncharacterized protein LOC130675946 [Microplitis mediator]|uniref:uncharacterized protein LOC130675946 n=1 Tax=Microplitis mediator TaxID=375433 RepID=UPI00255225DC|nr:uncharacterized protein LOC130675946 [Microplitis mediator]
MNPDGPLIEWDHFLQIFEKDCLKPMHLRVCPKITMSHLELNNSSKMRVRLAAQIFSNSMVRALTSYQKEFKDKNFTATIEFCRWMNNLFDALNENCVSLKPGDDNFKLIEKSIKTLDFWEAKIGQPNGIKESSFLTRNTAEGLRVTLRSTLDVKVDVYECRNTGVLTGKINQALKFFSFPKLWKC